MVFASGFPRCFFLLFLKLKIHYESYIYLSTPVTIWYWVPNNEDADLQNLSRLTSIYYASSNRWKVLKKFVYIYFILTRGIILHEILFDEYNAPREMNFIAPDLAVTWRKWKQNTEFYLIAMIKGKSKEQKYSVLLFFSMLLIILLIILFPFPWRIFIKMVKCKSDIMPLNVFKSILWKVGVS